MRNSSASNRLKWKSHVANVENAESDLLAAEAGLREYRDGLMAQTREAFRGSIAPTRADLKKQEERLKMGRATCWRSAICLPAASATKNEPSCSTEQTLASSIRDRDHFETFGAPRVLSSHENKVYVAQTSLEAMDHRLMRHEERLAKFREQVDLCTIRAPHDGFLIHANEPDDDPRIEVGVQVRQKQDLFYLPDLSQMEVQTLLHEFILQRVHEGMPAKERAGHSQASYSKAASPASLPCPPIGAYRPAST